MYFLWLYLAGFITVNAQTVLFEDDFESYTIDAPNTGDGTQLPPDYTSYDVNGDSYNWGLSNPDNFTQPFGDIYTGNFMLSVSYHTGPNVAVNADNIMVLPMISIPEGATDVELSYFVGSGTDPDYFSETYDVIVTTENTQAAILAATPVLTETLPSQGGEVKTVSLDDFAGQDVYISFYHRDTFDEFVLGIDDISVTASTMSVSDLNKNVSSVYPNPVVDSFNVNLSSKFNANNVTVTVTDLAGRTVKTFGSASSFNVSDLAAGVYVVKITDGQNTETKKIVKK